MNKRKRIIMAISLSVIVIFAVAILSIPFVRNGMKKHSIKKCAVEYISDKYGFTPDVLRVEKKSPSAGVIIQADTGWYYVRMSYKGREFDVQTDGVSARNTVDNYSIYNIKKELAQKVAAYFDTEDINVGIAIVKSGEKFSISDEHDMVNQYVKTADDLTENGYSVTVSVNTASFDSSVIDKVDKDIKDNLYGEKGRWSITEWRDFKKYSRGAKKGKTISSRIYYLRAFEIDKDSCVTSVYENLDIDCPNGGESIVLNYDTNSFECSFCTDNLDVEAEGYEDVSSWIQITPKEGVKNEDVVFYFISGDEDADYALLSSNGDKKSIHVGQSPNEYIEKDISYKIVRKSK